MQPPYKHSRINIAELKDQLTRKLGPERSQQYFDYLKRFLSLKLSKIEFDKLCLTTVGKDSIPLHNKLILSILKNASIIENKKAYHENGSIPVVHKISGKEVSAGTLLHHPLGIQNGPVSIGGTRKSGKVSFLGSNSKFVTDGLLETTKLKEYMDQLVAIQGLEGVSMDCANVLNNSLDTYLKGLIRSFPKLSGFGSGAGHGPVRYGSMKHRARFGLPNGVIPGYYSQMQEHEPNRVISLLDFKVAMELNPRQLGGDWPVLLEKMYTHV